MGVGASKRISSVDWRIVKEMLIAWILTFGMWADRLCDVKIIYCNF